MKLNGLVGKGSGKLGSSVFAISGGEQIVRQYNPVVSNPSTDGQVEQRAKLKLMSQLAAALSRALAFRKQGLVSARNQFVSKNIGFCTFDENDGAQIDLEKLVITPGNAALPFAKSNIVYDDGNFVCQITENDVVGLDALVMVSVERQANDSMGKLNVFDIQVFPASEITPTNQPTIGAGNGDTMVMVYGIKYAKSGSNERYENYDWEAASTDAILGVLSSIVLAGASFTANVNVKHIAGA